MAVLDIAQYELVPTPELPGTARYILADFECLPRRDSVLFIHGIFHNKFKWSHHATWKIS